MYPGTVEALFVREQASARNTAERPFGPGAISLSAPARLPFSGRCRAAFAPLERGLPDQEFHDAIANGNLAARTLACVL
jgi:hypothetical protein